MPSSCKQSAGKSREGPVPAGKWRRPQGTQQAEQGMAAGAVEAGEKAGRQLIAQDGKLAEQRTGRQRVQGQSQEREPEHHRSPNMSTEAEHMGQIIVDWEHLHKGQKKWKKSRPGSRNLRVSKGSGCDSGHLFGLDGLLGLVGGSFRLRGTSSGARYFLTGGGQRGSSIVGTEEGIQSVSGLG